MFLLQQFGNIFVLVGEYSDQLPILSAQPIQHCFLEDISNWITFLLSLQARFALLLLDLRLMKMNISFRVINYLAYFQKLGSVYSESQLKYLSDCDFFI